MSLKLSVAMCTYNGERFVLEQLESIAAQTRQPDELVVCDDRSTDATAEIVAQFARRAPFTVRLFVNDENLGSTRNFARAIEACAGELIALSDQDDVWRPHKLARMEAALEAAPEAGMAFSDAEVVDERLRAVGYSLWQSVNFGAAEQELFRERRALELLLKRAVVTGATLTFRARFRDLVLPLREIHLQGFGLPGWNLIHDGWIAVLIAAAASAIPVGERLVNYRQHAGQQIGAATPQPQLAGGRGDLRARARGRHARACREEVERLLPIHERLSAQRGEFETGAAADELGARMTHYRARGHLPESRVRRVLPVLRELLTLRYRRYSNGLMSAAKDLLL